MTAVASIARACPRLYFRVFVTMTLLWSATACHGLFDVSDPTLIRDQDLANANGANGRRLNVQNSFLSVPPRVVPDVGYFTDEMSYDLNISRIGRIDAVVLDRRDGTGYQSMHQLDDPHLGILDGVVTSASIAIPPIRKYSPDDVRDDYLAQMFAFAGYAIVQMGEDICPGFPINDVTPENEPILSGPYTTDSALAYGIEKLDSALAHVKDSTQYRDFAAVVKGRALLDLGQYAEAAAAVASVSTDFVYGTYNNTLWVCPNCNWNNAGSPVGDYEGGNGLGFVSEHDTVRVPVRYMRQRISFPTIPEYAETKYASSSTPVILVSGREARLIEAEVALHNHDVNWLTILNALRTPVGLVPLTDPGTDSARVDLIYHERAFWMYLTGRRLGDLRRLIRNYGRHPENLFPVGSHPLVGNYGTATAIPYSVASESLYNPKITGCTAP